MGWSTCVTNKTETEIKTNMDIFITDISPTEWFPLNTNTVQVNELETSGPYMSE